MSNLAPNGPCLVNILQQATRHLETLLINDPGELPRTAWMGAGIASKAGSECHHYSASQHSRQPAAIEPLAE